MPGKNFSTNNMGQRRPADLYETPYSLTEQLLSVESFPEPILEPAAGRGAITRVLRGLVVEAYDRERDFLKESRTFPSIVTNPPYSLAHQFILKAKDVSTRKFALLLPLAYLHGKRRFDEIWQDQAFPLARLWVFTRYPMLGDALREDGRYRTGMMVYAWFVWDHEHSGPPHVGWLDNHPFVIGARPPR